MDMLIKIANWSGFIIIQLTLLMFAVYIFCVAFVKKSESKEGDKNVRQKF